jgi:NAD(P)-dependent dehydrogenase (short-subunit alcohol dehydrogenase family)
VLVARGQSGLDAAANDVRAAGGEALPIPTDVADSDQVEAAAARAEEVFGPIDTWVNVAFAGEFAPFDTIKPAEFRRVTEVTYLGYVYGTMAALARMKPRDHGHDRPGGIRAGLSRDPLAERLLRRQTRHSGLPRIAALRAAARWQQRPGDHGPDARGEHAAVQRTASSTTSPVRAARSCGPATTTARSARPSEACSRRPACSPGRRCTERISGADQRFLR